jgi:hypothetical protein
MSKIYPHPHKVRHCRKGVAFVSSSTEVDDNWTQFNRTKNPCRSTTSQQVSTMQEECMYLLYELSHWAPSCWPSLHSVRTSWSLASFWWKTTASEHHTVNTQDLGFLKNRVMARNSAKWHEGYETLSSHACTWDPQGNQANKITRALQAAGTGSKDGSNSIEGSVLGRSS